LKLQSGHAMFVHTLAIGKNQLDKE